MEGLKNNFNTNQNKISMLKNYEEIIIKNLQKRLA